MAVVTHPARLHQIRWEAPHIISLELVAANGAPPFQPAPAGSHIDLHLGAGRVRSYSLVHPQQQGAYTVAVLKDRDSRGGSRHVHEQLRVGDVIPISPPRNHFALQEDAEHNVLVAGGIGITPIYAMLQRLAALGASAHLVYSARSRQDAAYVHAIQTLIQQNPQISVHWHWDGENGGPPVLTDLLAGHPPGSHFYACGPVPMLGAFEAACAQLGFKHVHLERFAAVQAPNTGSASAYTVELRRTGKTVAVPAGANLLDTLLSAGCDLPYSCHEGICGACETRVLSGEVEHLDSVLTHDEQTANQSMMVCVSRCRSGHLVLDV